jgi:hypothetical protein
MLVYEPCEVASAAPNVVAMSLLTEIFLSQLEDRQWSSTKLTDESRLRSVHVEGMMDVLEEHSLASKLSPSLFPILGSETSEGLLVDALALLVSPVRCTSTCLVSA